MLVPNIILGTPIKKNPRLTNQITNHITKYFGPIYRGFTAAQLKAQIDWDTLVRYGRFRLVGDGDSVRTADTIQRDPTVHDNSFVRVRSQNAYLFIYLSLLMGCFRQYDLLPDTNARFRNQPDEPVRVTHYGQVLDIYYVESIEDPQ
jgi:hypothetical protein